VDGIHREAAGHRGCLGQYFSLEFLGHFGAALSADPGADATASVVGSERRGASAASSAGQATSTWKSYCAGSSRLKTETRQT
jgi:hypothetical protein